MADSGAVLLLVRLHTGEIHADSVLSGLTGHVSRTREPKTDHAAFKLGSAEVIQTDSALKVLGRQVEGIDVLLGRAGHVSSVSTRARMHED